ncbi:uncharacterized protein STEHIDRAFT_46411 [Stereum hirsutum FP-91666 SS1]|uniref:uncharacterized protein n=1 Tax=Stereum hirsutum (strain FP-91666) TaxID=721885 RepID=UPI000440C2B6|nr:uncharacterized protein STEHIDRAFT_46411 [Stereum hirsutum FP-91666 SS1]EIM92171.1 hypothetical protein STEHIDRAFT_46411 [Stereum hirsutum FP-91666 SS1]
MSPVIRLDAPQHPLTAVTIFKSSKAEIVRSFKQTFQEGQNKVEIFNLPGSIDTESARINITGLSDLQLFDVVCTKPKSYISGVTASASTFESIRILEAKKSALVAERDTISSAKTFLESYSKTLKGEDISPEQAEGFLDTYVKRARKLVQEGAELQEQIQKIEQKIQKERDERNKRKGSMDGTVNIVVMAKRQTEAEFKLTYIAHGASWTPSYELHATTDSGRPASSVSLHYRASITQTTGEDWSDVPLTLSTASMDNADQRVPEIQALRIRPPVTELRVRSSPPHPAMRVRMASRGATRSATFPLPDSSNGGSYPENWDEDDDEEGEPGAPEGDSTPASTVINESPLSLSYTVEGRSSIPTDGVAHKVSVAILKFEAKVMHVAVPRVRAQAYLQAQVVNNSDFRLLPGPVTILMNDSYVSKTSIQDIAPGDSFDCTFGPDTSTRISYTRSVKRSMAAASAFTEQYTTTTYISVIKVHNRHAFTIDKIVLRDALAVSDDETKVKVLLKKPQSLLDEQDSSEDQEVEGLEKGIARWRDTIDEKGGKKDGLFEWICEGLEAGKEISLETVWDVRAPADVKWVES